MFNNFYALFPFEELSISYHAFISEVMPNIILAVNVTL